LSKEDLIVASPTQRPTVRFQKVHADGAVIVDVAVVDLGNKLDLIKMVDGERSTSELRYPVG
jgi:hypothetical protein